MKHTKTLFTFFLAALMTFMMAFPRPARAQHIAGTGHWLSMFVLTVVAVYYGANAHEYSGLGKIFNGRFGALVLAFFICGGIGGIFASTPNENQWEQIKKGLGEEVLKQTGDPSLSAAIKQVDNSALDAALERARQGASAEEVAQFLAARAQ